MTVRVYRALPLMLLLLFAGCASDAPPGPPQAFAGTIDQTLRSADRFELLSLDPMPVDAELLADPDAQVFQGYRVLGSAVITDAADRDRLIDALYRGIHASDGSAADCFNPRHGIRATRGEDTVDIVICFECLSMATYVNDQQRQSALTTGAPAGAFNAAGDRAGLRRPSR